MRILLLIIPTDIPNGYLPSLPFPLSYCFLHRNSISISIYCMCIKWWPCFISGQVSTEPEQHVSTCLTSLKKHSIRQKPSFIQPIASSTVPYGEVARFHAFVSGTPKPYISWFHNQQAIQPSKDVVFHFDDVTNTATLILVDAFPEHAGQYTCRAANSAGEAVCSATLIICREEGNLIPHQKVSLSLDNSVPSSFPLRAWRHFSQWCYAPLGKLELHRAAPEDPTHSTVLFLITILSF